MAPTTITGIRRPFFLILLTALVPGVLLAGCVAADEPTAEIADAMRGGQGGKKRDAGSSTTADAGSSTTADAGSSTTADAGSSGATKWSSGTTTTADAGATGPTVRPGPTNTGVPAGTTLGVHEGDLTITQDGTVIDSLDIRGWLRIHANDVTVRRSIVRGRAGASANGAGIEVRGGVRVVLEDDEVALAYPSRYIDGLWLGYSGAASTVARRLKVSGGVDGMKIGSNTRVESSWIHGNAIFPDDPNVGGQTHNDCVQVLSGAHIVLLNNFLEAAREDNAEQVTQDFGLVTDLQVLENWADGGGCTFNFAHKVASSLTGVTVTANRFGRGSYYACPILVSTATTLTMSGNVWDDTGAIVPVQRHD